LRDVWCLSRHGQGNSEHWPWLDDGKMVRPFRGRPRRPMWPMKLISYQRHSFPPTIIRHAVWLYFRLTLSLGDVENLLAERGIEVSCEAIGTWTQKFGAQFAQNLRRLRSKPTGRWQLDERVARIGRRMFLWRAVDEEGEILDSSSRSGTTNNLPRGGCAKC
jgi:hypothetical protein